MFLTKLTQVLNHKAKIKRSKRVKIFISAEAENTLLNCYIVH